MKLESLLQYVGEYLGVEDHPDYPTALNGLQVGGPEEVTRIAAAVDSSESVIHEAIEGGANLLLVHHGLFWDGLRPVTGRRHRKLKSLMDNNLALYSVHLPLDSHPEVGNSALLARELGVSALEAFGEYKGRSIGWAGDANAGTTRAELQATLAAKLGGSVHLIPGGPERIDRIGVVTGGGASFTEAAADRGLDALITGEGSHHTHADAMELGINVFFGGHYATETYGVRALAEHLAERFDLDWFFVDRPTGL